MSSTPSQPTLGPQSQPQATTLHTYLSSLPEFRSGPRIQSLYSDLGRQKLSNASGYTANLSWWRKNLKEMMRMGLQPDAKDILILKVDQSLSDSFLWEKVGRPAGLGTVVDDLMHDGTLHPLAQFLSSNVSIYESTSVVGRVADLLIKRSLWWALGQLSLVQNTDDETPAARWKRVCGDYVVVSVLEKLADAIIAVQDEKSALTLSESLYSVDSFKKYAETCVHKEFEGSKTLSETDLKVLLKYLQRDRKVIVVRGDVIKFAENERDKGITSVDQGVLELKTTIERVELQVEHIQNSITTRTSQIKAALLASRKEIAKLQLSSRHALSSLLTQRLNTLANLQAALNSIDQAHGDAAIMRAYEKSSSVLKELMSRPEMQRERVDEVMDRLREGMEDAEDLRKAVEEGGWEVVEAVGAGVDEDELAKELEELVKEETERRKQEKAQPTAGEEKRILELTRKLNATELNEKAGTPSANERVAEVA